MKLVWAQGRDRAIGIGGRIPWRLPADQARFKELTLGGTVGMGRLTWESLPASVRPLPGRRNVVVSRTLSSLAGAEVVGSVGELAALDPEAWVIGGERVYSDAVAGATDAYVTEVDVLVPGADAFAPVLSGEWQLCCSEPPVPATDGQPGYFFSHWRRT